MRSLQCGCNSATFPVRRHHVLPLRRGDRGRGHRLVHRAADASKRCLQQPDPAFCLLVTACDDQRLAGHARYCPRGRSVNAGILPPPSQYAAPPRAIGGAPAAPVPTPGRIDGVLDWRRDMRTQWPAMRESMLATIRGNTFVWRKYTSRATFPTATALAGGVLMADGRVYMPPVTGTTARIYDPRTDSVSIPGGTFPGSLAHFAGALLPDGRIYIFPYNATTARIYDPITDSLSTPAGTFPGGFQHFGGCVMADGRVYISPGGTPTAANARIYNPAANSLIVAGGAFNTAISYRAAMPLPSGDVLVVPFTGNPNTPLYIYRPQTDSLFVSASVLNTVQAPDNGSVAYGCVLMADERVFIPPSHTTTALIYDWKTDQMRIPSGTYARVAGQNTSHIGGALLPDGTIALAPAFSSVVRCYDPRTDTLTNPDPATTYTGSNDYNNACVLADGRLFMMPRNVANPVIYGVAGSRTFDTNLTTSSFWNHK